VDVNLTSEGRAKLQLGDSVAFSYEVVWKTSDTKFEVRVNQKVSARKEVTSNIILEKCKQKHGTGGKNFVRQCYISCQFNQQEM